MNARAFRAPPGADITWPIMTNDGKALSSQQKWRMQKLQYAQSLIDAKVKVTQVAADVGLKAGPADLASYKKIGGFARRPQLGPPAVQD